MGGYPPAGIFFDHIPADTGLAFVVVDHKPPNSDYTLSQFFQAHTQMPVIPISDELAPQANTVYVLSGKNDVILVKGVFKTISRPNVAVASTIDTFFSSLAESERGNAIAIILSGMLNDGTEGMKAIKHYQGTTIAQDPRTARFCSMPQSAMDAGAVDFVLTPDKIAALVLQR